MKIGIIGTGMVGQTLGAKLVERGHAVMIGTRDLARTLARTESDAMGNPPFSAWHKQHPHIKLGTFAEAAAHGEIVINASSGAASIEALKIAGETNLNGKILMDVANPLDFSKGMPPMLSVCNTDSLGEQIQRAFPKAKVVKTLNTVNAALMVSPHHLADGEHDLFVSGNDAEAKTQVVHYLKTWFGWKHVIDLGDITTARGAEMLMPIWLRLWGVFKTANFNYKIVK
jgi:hypothetical protein